MIKMVNDKEGTNKNRSPTLAPLMMNKLLVGEEAKQKNKIQNDNIGIFRICNMANTNNVP